MSTQRWIHNLCHHSKVLFLLTTTVHFDNKEYDYEGKNEKEEDTHHVQPASTQTIQGLSLPYTAAKYISVFPFNMPSHAPLPLESGTFQGLILLTKTNTKTKTNLNWYKIINPQKMYN